MRKGIVFFVLLQAVLFCSCAVNPTVTDSGVGSSLFSPEQSVSPVPFESPPDVSRGGAEMPSGAASEESAPPEFSPEPKPEGSISPQPQSEASVPPVTTEVQGEASPPAENSSPEDAPEEEELVSVTLKVLDELILDGYKVPCDGEMTVYDALEKACSENEIELIVRGKGKTAYIVSMAGYAEFSQGAMSGWLYELDGVRVSKGVGSVKVKPGSGLVFFFVDQYQ